MASRLQFEDQGELAFTTATEGAPIATVEDVERLVGILYAGHDDPKLKLESNGWMTAAEICENLGLPPTETNKRKVRAAAEAGRPGIVSFPASTGYKLSAQCNDEEKLACLSSWSESRSKCALTEMLYRRHFHSLGLRP